MPSLLFYRFFFLSGAFNKTLEEDDLWGFPLGFHFLQKGFAIDFEETEYTLTKK